jgi:hypothetical protein
VFESLSERIHQDEAREEPARTRITRYVIIGLVSAGAVAVLAAFIR